MPLLKGLNVILLISGSQLGLVYQNIYMYQALLGGGRRHSHYWEGSYPLAVGVNKHKWRTTFIKGTGSPWTQGPPPPRTHTRKKM